jgi:ribosomal protein S12 methylthiotransferase accessory factor
MSAKDRQGILRSIDRCTVKKVVQAGPEFVIEEVENLDADAQALLAPNTGAEGNTYIVGKDLPLEQTIANMSTILANLGIKIEIASWRNLIPNVWSLHIRDAHSPMCFTNGKGATKESALASALGEYIERLSNNHFYAGAYWGEDIANAAFVHYPHERWFKPGKKDALPPELLDEYCRQFYNPEGVLRASHLIDTNSGNRERGICALPFVRQSDQEVVYFPLNLIENMFVSYGINTALFLVFWVALLLSYPDYTLSLLLGILTAVVILSLPISFRLSRSIWLALFVRFDPKASTKVDS